MIYTIRRLRAEGAKGSGEYADQAFIRLDTLNGTVLIRSKRGIDVTHMKRLQMPDAMLQCTCALTDS